MPPVSESSPRIAIHRALGGAGRRRRARGFTLVELMVVVVLVGGVSGMMMAMYSRNQRGEKAPKFARALHALAQETRHAAVAAGVPARLRLVPGPPVLVLSEIQNLTNPALYDTLGTTLPVSGDLELCAVEGSTRTAPFSPSCPLAATTSVCFQPSGRVAVTAGATCTGVAPTGATIFTRSRETATTAQRRHKLLVWRLTGLPRLVDSW